MKNRLRMNASTYILILICTALLVLFPQSPWAQNNESVPQTHSRINILSFAALVKDSSFLLLRLYDASVKRKSLRCNQIMHINIGFQSVFLNTQGFVPSSELTVAMKFSKGNLLFSAHSGLGFIRLHKTQTIIIDYLPQESKIRLNTLCFPLQAGLSYRLDSSTKKIPVGIETRQGITLNLLTSDDFTYVTGGNTSQFMLPSFDNISDIRDTIII